MKQWYSTWTRMKNTFAGRKWIFLSRKHISVFLGYILFFLAIKTSSSCHLPLYFHNRHLMFCTLTSKMVRLSTILGTSTLQSELSIFHFMNCVCLFCCPLISFSHQRVKQRYRLPFSLIAVISLFPGAVRSHSYHLTNRLFSLVFWHLWLSFLLALKNLRINLFLQNNDFLRHPFIADSASYWMLRNKFQRSQEDNRKVARRELQGNRRQHK